MPLPWPRVLVPSREVWTPNHKPTRGGGRSIVATEQVVSAPTGYVRAQLTIPCHGDDRILEARALIAALDGRSGSVLVPPVEGLRPPWVRDRYTGAPVTPAVVAAARSRDPAYANNPELSADLRFALAESVSRNAVRLVIARQFGGVVRRGMFLGLGGDRLHVVTGLDAPDDGTAATVAVTIRPWTRAAYAAGSPVEFARPVCVMGLASDDTGALEAELSRLASMTLDLVEKPAPLAP